jgi:hypothetical protein
MPNEVNVASEPPNVNEYPKVAETFILVVAPPRLPTEPITVSGTALQLFCDAIPKATTHTASEGSEFVMFIKSDITNNLC